MRTLVWHMYNPREDKYFIEVQFDDKKLVWYNHLYVLLMQQLSRKKEKTNETQFDKYIGLHAFVTALIS